MGQIGDNLYIMPVSINFVMWNDPPPHDMYPLGLRLNHNSSGYGAGWALIEYRSIISDQDGCTLKVKDLKSTVLGSSGNMWYGWKGWNADMTYHSVSYSHGQGREMVIDKLKMTSNHCLSDI